MKFSQNAEIIIILLLGTGIVFCLPLFSFVKTQDSELIDTSDAEAISSWLSKKAIPLKSVEAGNGFDDLMPLKQILKNVRIVALGESTHGAREFFQLKHRMLEFLVTEMDFTVFAIEASYPACMNINDYVLYGKGDCAKALASQKFWTWDTNEVADLIEWIRQYNKTVAEEKKVKFVGFDLQHIEQAKSVILSYIEKISPKYFETADKAMKFIDIRGSMDINWTNEDTVKIEDNLNRLMGYLSFNKIRFSRVSGDAEYEKVMQHARVLYQFFDTFTRPALNPYGISHQSIPGLDNPASSSVGIRDYYMAENIENIIKSEKPETRVVVWIHNTHLSVKKQTYTGWKEVPPMGYYLRKFFGLEYYAFGFVFNNGSFQGIIMDKEDDNYKALTEFTLEKAEKGTIEWYLAQPGIKNYIIDFRLNLQKKEVTEWLNTSRLMINIGGGFSADWSYQYLVPTVLTDHFDGIVYIDEISRARPNPSGIRRSVIK